MRCTHAIDLESLPHAIPKSPLINSSLWKNPMPQTFTGNTLFTLHEKLCPFRFEVCVTNENNVVIWIENRESKQQWQTSSLELKEFVTSDNAIPKASADDYAARFAACLENDDESSNYHHSLSVEAKGGVRTLKLSVPLSWGSHTLTVDYIFSLTQVPLERVDILGARLRDVEDLLQTDRAVLQTKLITSNVSFEEKVNGLAERVKELEHQIELRMKPVCVHAILTAESQNIPHRSVPWVTDVCSDYKNIRIHPDGRIQLSLAGLYAVSICIVHSRSSNDTVYALTKCGKILATCAGYSPNGTYVSSPLQKIVKVNADEELCVEYKASGYVYSAGSYISITKL